MQAFFVLRISELIPNLLPLNHYICIALGFPVNLLQGIKREYGVIP